MKLIDLFLDALFPPRCIVCREITPSGRYFCKNCVGKITPVAAETCLGCGLEVRNCECDRFIYHFDGIVAPFSNDGAAQASFYDYKFHQKLRNAEFFAESMARAIRAKTDTDTIDFICWVPTDRKRKRERGFDQCERLAVLLSEQLRIPLKRNFLHKIRFNKIQHGLKMDDRFYNVRGVYTADGRADGKTVLLVDDIKTTGATLDECARQLKFAGAEKVLCATALIGSFRNP